jgi:hypothetical protein
MKTKIPIEQPIPGNVSYTVPYSYDEDQEKGTYGTGTQPVLNKTPIFSPPFQISLSSIKI